MTNQNSQVHYTTTAEASLMETIDIVVKRAVVDKESCVDFDFLRDYMVCRLQTKFMNAGVRSHIDSACRCVYLDRHVFSRRKLAHKKFNKKL